MRKDGKKTKVKCIEQTLNFKDNETSGHQQA